MLMSSTQGSSATEDRELKKAQARERRFSYINKASSYLGVMGLGWSVPLMKIAAGDNPKSQGKELWQQLFVPLIGILCFLVIWATTVPNIQTSLGAIPGPVEV